MATYFCGPASTYTHPVQNGFGNETRHTSHFSFFIFSHFEILFHSLYAYVCDVRIGLVLTRKYYLKLLSEKMEEPLFSDK